MLQLIIELIKVYLHSYCIYTSLAWLMWVILEFKCVKLSYFSILYCLMQMLLENLFFLYQHFKISKEFFFLFYFQVMIFLDASNKHNTLKIYPLCQFIFSFWFLISKPDFISHDSLISKTKLFYRCLILQWIFYIYLM